MRRKHRIRGVLLGVGLGMFTGTVAAAPQEYTLVIKDHQFSPKELAVPAGKKIKLTIENHDSTPEEFESYDLNREKLVTGNGKITVFVGPLKPGEYKYFGEFNEATAQGVLIAEDRESGE